MNKEITNKLWILKLCIKIIYPKYHHVLFLVFLAIKSRKLLQNKYLKCKTMNNFGLKTIPLHVQRLIAEDHLYDNLSIILHKCLIISRNQYIELASENLFYLDNGVLWVAIRLSASMQKKCKNKSNSNKKAILSKCNFSHITSEVHKRLWTNDLQSIDKYRIVPVIGSTYIEDNVIVTTENEHYNLSTTFGLDPLYDVEISIYSVPKIDNAPKIAETAEVKLIVNEYDVSNDFVKEILSSHFEVPKLVHVNDIFSIELTPEVTNKYHYRYIDLIDSVGLLQFKCSKLDKIEETSNHIDNLILPESIDQPFFIVKGITQLSLGESIHEIRPKDEYFNLTNTNRYKSQLIKSCPFGLNEKFRQLQEIINPFLTNDINELSSSLSKPLIPLLLLTGSIGAGRHLIVKTLARYNGMNYIHIDCNALMSSTAKQTESKISAMIQKTKTASPAIALLDNFEVFAVDPENNEDCRLVEYFSNSLTDLYQNFTKHSIIFIAVTERTELKPNILRLFLDKVHIGKLNSSQRLELLQWFITVMGLKLENEMEKKSCSLKLHENVDLSKLTIELLQRISAKTEAFSYGDIDTLLHFTLRESYLDQAKNDSCSDNNLDLLIDEQHFNKALDSMRALQSQHLDAPNIPKVYWEDIGGLEKLKKELLKTVEFPIKYPHLFKNSSLKRSGILLYGPPGCGKTLVAKAVSTELNVSFLSIKGPELLNMYIGQSEENVRRVFETARSSSPCIVFLDELDSLAARRGAAGDSGGASDRLVSQLLAELDGVNDDADSTSFVFVMGATNRPDLLEQSLLRPGRLDKLIYVGPYCGLQEKTNVLTALCRSYNLRPEVRLTEVAAALPERCTGADLLQVVSTARDAAVRAIVAKVDAGLIKECELSPESVIIGVADMLEGVTHFRPSVTDQELAYYESLQNQM